MVRNPAGLHAYLLGWFFDPSCDRWDIWPESTQIKNTLWCIPIRVFAIMAHYLPTLFQGKTRFIFTCINLPSTISPHGVVDGKDHVVVGGLGVFKSLPQRPRSSYFGNKYNNVYVKFIVFIVRCRSLRNEHSCYCLFCKTYYYIEIEAVYMVLAK